MRHQPEVLMKLHVTRHIKQKLEQLERRGATLEVSPIHNESADDSWIEYRWTIPESIGQRLCLRPLDAIVPNGMVRVCTDDAFFNDTVMMLVEEHTPLIARFLDDEDVRNIAYDLVSRGGEISVDARTIDYAMSEPSGTRYIEMFIIVGQFMRLGSARARQA